MLASSLFSLLTLAVGSLASPVQRATPTAPAVKYLFTLHLATAPEYDLGDTPAGNRIYGPVSGGNFSGPGINGKVIGGLDTGLTDARGDFNPDGTILLQTSDGCLVLVREHGHAPNVLFLFETASTTYGWLNDVVAYGGGGRVTGGVVLDVWKIGTYKN